MCGSFLKDGEILRVSGAFTGGPEMNEACPYRLFDTHCHLDFDVFSNDFPLHLHTAYRYGVERLVIPSIGPQNWQRVIGLSEQAPSRLFYGLGIHPYFLHADSMLDVGALELVLEEHTTTQCVAIGECGLDATVALSAGFQEQILILQLSLAKQMQLPVILHSRKTHERLLFLLKKHRFQYGGVIHAFSGSLQQAQRFIDLGFKIGVGGVITYTRAQKTRLTISHLPDESLVLETDAPDMPLSGFQGQLNHPKQLPLILEALAGLRNVSPGTLSDQLWTNSHRLFHIDESK